MKLTPQRIAIIEYLEGNLSHPSAVDVYKAVSQRFPTISFATVYNNLETLRKEGRLLELAIDVEKKRFDPNTMPHHHLICTKCRTIKDIFTAFSLDLSDKEQWGFDVTGNHVDFYGICPDCKKAATITKKVVRKHK